MDILIDLFKALSDRNRLRVVAALMAYKELCACQLTELLQISGATVSRHMGILISSGLVSSRKDGRWVIYNLNVEEPSFGPIMNYIKNKVSTDSYILSDIEILEKITAIECEELCRKQRGEECCPK
ncbi:ArsR/SmtB family transcription factor [Desulfovibrio gilichinskyi]|uniref:Transcriptional regulator, ArsR family n=1 Tax=Desulfovibrio gilichinskyi TaxID=1519643 RepID=A0A1X7CEW2_9BACT|nr:metalloregulator ArsR/SmtB family transcription factor [Desulfovibrio gilichinskyi]SME95446.1 transcriptional regulator, ArsR family [Desulfovibrio gilichinskyi]